MLILFFLFIIYLKEIKLLFIENFKEYYDSGQLLYEGEYINGEKNGKAKEYNWKGILIKKIQKK